MKKRGFVKDKLTSGGDRGNIFWFGIGLKASDNQNRGESGEVFSEVSEKRPF
jgi:hypothetical protein